MGRLSASELARRVFVLLLAGACTSCSLPAVSQPSPRMEKDMSVDKRSAPPAPKVVSRTGIRYEEVQFERSEGQVDQNSGYIAAVDDASGRRLWVLKVYTVGSDTDVEGDLQDVFMTQLELSPDEAMLLVTNEEERRFAVNLADRSVRELK